MKKKKKILILGAGHSQLPLITRARKLNYYLIICSYDDKEPGAGLADEFYRISVTDKQAVLKLAKEKNVQFVISHGSDVAAPTVAYVSEFLQLPGNPFETVQMMTNKALFRSFLMDNEFNVPEFRTFCGAGAYSDLNLRLNFPLLVKPVDSSGGRGIYKVNGSSELESALSEAVQHSPQKTVIAEEFIETNTNQVHGNGFVLDGELVFSWLGDHHFSPHNEIIPVGTSWPCRLPKEQKLSIEKEVSRFIRLSGYRFGPINIEARIDKNDQVYLVELAPRTAVNHVAELTSAGTGVDTTLQLFKYLNNEKVDLKKKRTQPVAYYLIHSDHDGIFKKTIIDPTIEAFVFEQVFSKKAGDRVYGYRNMTDTIGTILFKFDSHKTMHDIMKRINRFITVVVT